MTGSTQALSAGGQRAGGPAAQGLAGPGSAGPGREAPFQLRGGNFTLMVLRVGDPRNPNFFPVLAGKLAQAPNFFRNAPVVLDLDDLPPGLGFDYPQFCGLLRNLGLLAVGMQGGTPEQQQAALAAGLAVFPAARGAKLEAIDPLAGSGRSAAQGAIDVPPATAVQPPPAAPASAMHATTVPANTLPANTLVVSEPVRSGRQIYAEGGDLVVVGPVSAGAELVADGSIHVYGALRGRALAGAKGNREARIFCHSLEAEMVSIAGLYRISEDMDKKLVRKPVQVFRDDSYLHIAPIGL